MRGGAEEARATGLRRAAGVQRGHQRGVRGAGRPHPHLRAVPQQQDPVGERRAGRRAHRELRGELEQRGGPRELGRGERPGPAQTQVLGSDPDGVDVAGLIGGGRVDQPGPQHRGHRAGSARGIGHHHPGQRERRGGRVGQLRGVGPHQQRARDAGDLHGVDEVGRIHEVGHLHQQLVGDRPVVGRLTHHVQRDDVATGGADGGGQLAEPTRAVLQLHVHPPQRHAVHLLGDRISAFSQCVSPP